MKNKPFFSFLEKFFNFLEKFLESIRSSNDVRDFARWVIISAVIIVALLNGADIIAAWGTL